MDDSHIASSIEQYQQASQTKENPDTIPVIILVASPPSKGYLAPTVKQEISGRDVSAVSSKSTFSTDKKEQNERLCIPSTTPRNFYLN